MTGANNTMRRVLIANRGEIAVRIALACKAEGLESVVAVSDADSESLAAQMANLVVHIGPSRPALSYLRVEQVVAGALLSGCDAVHPGYGFLSERPELAEACADHGLTFVGPSAETIRSGGDKVAARSLARAAGVPVAAGSDIVSTVEEASTAAEQIGYPIVLKAAAGGGGRGMVQVDGPVDLRSRFAAASTEAESAFGDGRLYLERFIERARHVEVQILADGFGTVVHLGDRDCSLQRRYQKVVEEAPAAAVPGELRQRLADAAVTLARELSYVGAGTVEFLVDLGRADFSFLELNTRVQVEHPVTEAVTGVDIVREQLRIAAGKALSFRQEDIAIAGHAIECRINAETPSAGFLPSPGRIEIWSPPTGADVRVDTHVFEGYEVPPFYDSLLAKLIVSGPDRETAIRNMETALDAFRIEGVDTTLDVHRAVVSHPDFRVDHVDTQWFERVLLASAGIKSAT